MLAIAKSHLNNPQVKTYEEILSEIEKITAEDVLEVANEVFHPDDMSVLIYNARENDRS
jgi:predicted Zn-dependent peptidase